MPIKNGYKQLRNRTTNEDFLKKELGNIVDHQVLTALIVQAMRILLRQCYYKVTILRSDRLRVIPLQVVRLLGRPSVL